MSEFVVLKFGGSSVSSKTAWDNIAKILQARSEASRPFVVCSALSGISDSLERLAEKAAGGEGYQNVLNDIIKRHRDMAKALGLDPDDVIGELLSELSKLAQGAALINEVSPRLWARFLSTGELFSTKLGAAYLQKSGLDVLWLDARSMLKSKPEIDPNRAYLSARCAYEANLSLQKILAEKPNAIFLTQGFLGANARRETVLLGRGGSDTSAAYFASILSAKRLEIWSDVPGMFTANPKQVPSARLLKILDYDEAQEMATTGAKALHPRCIAPVREAQIPLHLYSTKAPEIDGTKIIRQAEGTAGLKGISIKKGIYLVSMSTVGMWQQVGFLANIFGVFAKHGISIDLVTTSEANVTVSLDASANHLPEELWETLFSNLGKYCKPELIGPCAMLSLVGRRIRSILHQLGPVLERFSDQKVHLLSQAASDLNLSFVVEESAAESLLRGLHAKLFADVSDSNCFGPTWNELFSPVKEIQPAWWLEKQDKLLPLAENSPCYVYDIQTLKRRAQELLDISDVSRLHFAIKANSHPKILQIFSEKGLSFECVSPEEVAHVRKYIGEEANILFTPNFANRTEYEFGFEHNATVTLDNLYPLEHWPETFQNRSIILRIDPGAGRGHHKHVVTAGSESKFGIPPRDLSQVWEICDQYNINVIGLHAHAGSGIRDGWNWREKAELLAKIAEERPSIRILNLGGGFGVPFKQGQSRLDLELVAQSLSEFKKNHPQFELWIEPGRYLVAEAGVLLGKVTQTKSKGSRIYIGCDIGMNSLIRPALYGAWHDIFNLSKIEQRHEIVADVVGPICESGDVLGRGRSFPQTMEGDTLLITTAGAYGRVMSSLYNLRKPAEEFFIE